MAQFTDRLSREATDVDYVSAHLPRTLSPTQGFTFERNWEAGEPWETLLLSEAALHVWWATVLLFWMTWLSVALCGICICRLHWSAAFCLSQSDLSAVISILEHCCSVQRAVTLVQLAFVNWDVTWRQALLPLFFSREKKKQIWIRCDVFTSMLFYRQIRDTVHWMFSEAMLVYYIGVFRDAFWPNGKLAPPPTAKSDEQRQETKQRAQQKLLENIPGENTSILLSPRSNNQKGNWLIKSCSAAF